MEKIVPNKLKPGDEIRVIAPARSLKIIGQDSREIARKRFEEAGLKVTFGDLFASAAVEKRLEDLHEAFADKRVKAIFTVIGGANSNMLLPYIDYELIKQNPKVFCGFSDITALLNGIYAKTGMVTFSGPHFSSLGMLKGAEYTLDNLWKMVMGSGENEAAPSAQWSDDAWFINQNERNFIANEGWKILQPGAACGLLLGTSFRPAFNEPTILFVEDCFTSGGDAATFERNLQALCYQEDFGNVKGVVIGRFQKASEVSSEKLAYIVRNQRALKNLPVLADVDFGHTTPLLTLPIGGTAELDTEKRLLKLKI